MILVTQVLWKRILMHESDYLLVFLMLEAYNSFLFSVCSCYKLSYLLVNSPTFSFSIRLWVPCCQLSPKFQASSYTALALHFWTRGLWIHGWFFRVVPAPSFTLSLCGLCLVAVVLGLDLFVVVVLVRSSLCRSSLVLSRPPRQGGRNFRPFPVASSFCLSCMRVRVCVRACVRVLACSCFCFWIVGEGVCGQIQTFEHEHTCLQLQ